MQRAEVFRGVGLTELSVKFNWVGNSQGIITNGPQHEMLSAQLWVWVFVQFACLRVFAIALSVITA